MKIWTYLVYMILIFVGVSAQAQSQKAIVVNQGALVYKDADFDAEVVGQLKAGQVYDVSLKQKGPFYKIRLKPGLTGWIADNDIRLSKGGKAAAAKTPEKDAKKTDKPADDKNSFLEKKRVKSFYSSRYRGPILAYLSYAENTMGKVRTSNMPFYGVRVAGPNTMFSGDFRTDAEFLFHFGAPKYYEKGTGYPANGWVFLTDFTFETASPQSKWHMLTYGFGPMFKYTHYEVTLLQSGKEVSYSLDDMTLGAVFDLGLHFRIANTYALRFNVKYYWEKTQYWGGAFTFGFPF
ncbi:SH3 domain-containing protein [Bdellovibrio sp. HCB337]|uniref:SH3 domain-containing protein n=1 Tax=Bdellovibrio sp. HCB337 TaxID=3394358 RepID=UPI0039A75D74